MTRPAQLQLPLKETQAHQSINPKQKLQLVLLVQRKGGQQDHDV